jgi:hypothetical protein
MKDYLLANLTVRFTEESRSFLEGSESGNSKIVIIESSDGLKAEVSIQEFDSGNKHIRLTEFLTTPPPLYSHLIKNGTMTVQVREDGKWVALLRALRPGGKDHPTLNNISIEELDKLLGLNSKDWLIDLGFEFGTWSELNPKAAKFKDSLAVAIEPTQGNLLVLPWALTRVIALMKQLGKPTLDF